MTVMLSSCINWPAHYWQTKIGPNSGKLKDKASFCACFMLMGQDNFPCQGPCSQACDSGVYRRIDFGMWLKASNDNNDNNSFIFFNHFHIAKLESTKLFCWVELQVSHKPVLWCVNSLTTHLNYTMFESVSFLSSWAISEHFRTS